MKHKTTPTIGALAGLFLAAGWSLATARPLRAENNPSAQTINLTAGQARLIDHLKKDSKPAIHVIQNPHALVIHDETPGQLLLLGAERGQWDLTITRDDGAQVTYHVSIAAIADRTAPLAPALGGAVAADATPSLPAVAASRKVSPEVIPTHVLVDAVSADFDPHRVKTTKPSSSVVL